MTRVYIAAPYPLREQAILVRHVLELQHIEVTSRWLRDEEGPSDASARMDLDDVADADILLALNPEGWKNAGTGGRWVEFGYAIALNKKILLVGARTNVFCHLSAIKVVDGTEDLAKHIHRLAETPP